MLNTNAQIVSPVTPTDDSCTLFITRMTYILSKIQPLAPNIISIRDDDVSDTIKTEIRLVSQDNAEHIAKRRLKPR